MYDMGVTMQPAGTSYHRDNDITTYFKNCEFVLNPRFIQAYQAGKATNSWKGVDIEWRVHICCWAAQNGMLREGDFVECGVNRGGLAMTVLNYTSLHETRRKFYLLDTYNGLVEKYLKPEEIAMGFGTDAYTYEDCFDAVTSTFAKYPNVNIVRGAVPETLSAITSERIAYLSIDMNCVEPEIAAAEYCWDRLSSGAFVVLDDYGWWGHHIQKQAFDQFAAARGVEVLSLPTGQGLLVKP